MPQIIKFIVILTNSTYNMCSYMYMHALIMIIVVIIIIYIFFRWNSTFGNATIQVVWIAANISSRNIEMIIFAITL